MSAAPLAGVLFDLDGTLVDTAPDLAHALNAARAAEDLPPLPLAQVRPHVSRGGRGLVEIGFDDATGPPAAQADRRRARLLAAYAEAVCVDSALFPGMAAMLAQLESAGVSWGIVTNKPLRFTTPLLDALSLSSRAAVVVCGDTLAQSKPDPAPVRHALAQAGLPAVDTLMIGDDPRDVQAGRAAGTRTAVAGWGYLGATPARADWGADHWFDDVSTMRFKLLNWL